MLANTTQLGRTTLLETASILTKKVSHTSIVWGWWNVRALHRVKLPSEVYRTFVHCSRSVLWEENKYGILLRTNLMLGLFDIVCVCFDHVWPLMDRSISTQAYLKLYKVCWTECYLEPNYQFSRLGTCVCLRLPTALMLWMKALNVDDIRQVVWLLTIHTIGTTSWDASHKVTIQFVHIPCIS